MPTVPKKRHERMARGWRPSLRLSKTTSIPDLPTLRWRAAGGHLCGSRRPLGSIQPVCITMARANLCLSEFTSRYTCQATQAIPRNCFLGTNTRQSYPIFLSEVMSARQLATGFGEIEQSATLGSFRMYLPRQRDARENTLHACVSDARLDEYGFRCRSLFCVGCGGRVKDC
jgi:hypothetical protein